MATLYAQAFSGNINPFDMPVAGVYKQPVQNGFTLRLERLHLLSAAAGGEWNFTTGVVTRGKRNLAARGEQADGGG